MKISQIIEIESLCTRTLNRVAIAASERDNTTFVSSFADDAVWTRPVGEPMIGRTEIGKHMGRMPPDTRSYHVNGSVKIDVESSTLARAVSYTALYVRRTKDDGNPVQMKGPEYVVEYHDTFKPVGGEWLLATRTARYLFAAEYAPPAPGQNK